VTFSYDAPYAKDGDACAEAKGVATKKLVDMFVMLDRSGSMNYPCGTAKCEGTVGQPASLGDCNVGDTKTSKWCLTINALAKYFNSAAATSNAAALQVFTPPNVTLCNDAKFNQAAVSGAGGYLLLPTTGFNSALNGFVPQGSTPMVPAAKGISSYTAANRRAGRITVGVLITDGVPSAECFDPAYPATLAGQTSSISDSFQTNYTNNGILTFVIGMTGADFSILETIATGGNAPMHGDTVGAVTDACGNGAGPCRHWNIGDGNNDALAEALNQIQGFAVACKYNIPKPLVGAINYKDVVVSYDTTKLTKVNDAASCVADGWYYDNNLSPQTIELCPTQCSAAQANPAATINVSFGCLGG